MTYLLNEKAIEDINEIWLYTAQNWSVEQANRYYYLIIDEIHFIVQNYETAKNFESIRKSYKYAKVKSHLIFFKKIDNNKIEIIRVLHESMNLKNNLDTD